MIRISFETQYCNVSLHKSHHLYSSCGSVFRWIISIHVKIFIQFNSKYEIFENSSSVTVWTELLGLFAPVERRKSINILIIFDVCFASKYFHMLKYALICIAYVVKSNTKMHFIWLICEKEDKIISKIGYGNFDFS